MDMGGGGKMYSKNRSGDEVEMLIEVPKQGIHN